MRSVTCAPTRLVWPVCRFKTRDFAIVLPLLSWHDTVSVRRPIISIEEIKKNFFFFNCMRISVFRFRSFLLFFYTKNSRIHPFDIDADWGRGGEKGRKNSSRGAKNHESVRRIIVRVRGNERVSPTYDRSLSIR